MAARIHKAAARHLKSKIWQRLAAEYFVPTQQRHRSTAASCNMQHMLRNTTRCCSCVVPAGNLRRSTGTFTGHDRTQIAWLHQKQHPRNWANRALSSEQRELWS